VDAIQVQHFSMNTEAPIETRRLKLQRFTLADAQHVERLAGDARIAATTATIPHPYSIEAARAWIATHAADAAAKRSLTLAVRLRSHDALIGAISLLRWSPEHAQAELGYWIGVPHWGQGYATEAVTSVIALGRSLGITRVTGRCFASNPASARVMQKAGLEPEGCLRAHRLKNGVYQDLLLFAQNAPERQAGAG
jgi:[ribosomal protein S5]-alanine N-acetyltransferase